MKYRNRRMLLAINGIGRGPLHRDAPGDAGGEGGSGTTGDNAGTGKDGAGTTGKTPAIVGDFDKALYERTLQAARDGETKAKADAKAEKEKTAAILKALGLTPDGKTDPEEALKTAQAAQATAAVKARETAIELGIHRQSGKAGVNPDRALDSRSVMSKFTGLDPDAADFGDKVKALLEKALKDDPGLAAAAASAGKQGADITGSGGAANKDRSKSLDGAVKRLLTPS